MRKYPVGTLVSPIEGLKLEETLDYLEDYRVGTLVSPIEGLKRLWLPKPHNNLQSRNACKPD